MLSYNHMKTGEEDDISMKEHLHQTLNLEASSWTPQPPNATKTGFNCSYGSIL